MERGRVVGPFGTPIFGWKVTIDDGLPPAKLDYVKERVSEILGTNPPKVTRLSNTNLIIEG